MINQIIKDILQHEAPATIVTEGKEGAHVTATWNSYIEYDSSVMTFPAGGLKKTEQNILSGSKLILLIGSKEVRGKHSMGTGFRLTGKAKFVYSGEVFDKMKKRFSWLRASVVFTIEHSEQLL